MTGNTGRRPTAMDSEQFDLVVIGSGPAGEKGAAQAAYFGKKVALIEGKRLVGGTAANTGTLPSKTLRETALFLSGYRNRDLSGLNVTPQAPGDDPRLHAPRARRDRDRAAPDPGEPGQAPGRVRRRDRLVRRPAHHRRDARGRHDAAPPGRRDPDRRRLGPPPPADLSLRRSPRLGLGRDPQHPARCPPACSSSAAG